MGTSGSRMRAAHAPRRPTYASKWREDTARFRLLSNEKNTLRHDEIILNALIMIFLEISRSL